MAEFSPAERDERAKEFRHAGWTGKQLMEVAVHLQRIETGSVDAHLQEEREREVPAGRSLYDLMQSGCFTRPSICSLNSYEEWRHRLRGDISRTKGQIQSARLRDEIAEACFLEERLAVMEDRLAKAEATHAEAGLQEEMAFAQGGLVETTTDAALEDKAPYRRGFASGGIIDDGLMHRALRRSVETVESKVDPEVRHAVKSALAKPTERPGSLGTVVHDPNDPERRRR
jgi:hypothetical protein